MTEPLVALAAHLKVRGRPAGPRKPRRDFAPRCVSVAVVRGDEGRGAALVPNPTITPQGGKATLSGLATRPNLTPGHGVATAASRGLAAFRA